MLLNCVQYLLFLYSWYLYFAQLVNGFELEAIHDVVCRTKIIPAHCSRVSWLGRALGDDSLRIQTIPILVL